MLLRFYNIVLLVLFLTPNGFSQVDTTTYPKVSLYNNDTVIMFSIEQGKKLSIINENLKLHIAEKSILNNQLFEKDNIIRFQADKLSNFDTIISNYDTIIIESKNILKLCEEEKVILHLEVKQYRRQKFFAILIGGFTTSLMTYLLITK